MKIMKSIKIKDNEIWGLTKSYELTEHIQSYFFCYSASIFKNKKIFEWWDKIKAFTKRQEIVDKYELGMSNLMLQNHIKLQSIFKKNLDLKPITIIQKIRQKYREVFLKEIKYYKKNPTNYFWKDFYYKFGLVKIELIKANHKKINITELKKILEKNGNLEIEAINN